MSVVHMNTETFRKLVIDESRPTLIEFWAPWCVYCRRIGPAMDKVAEQREGSLTVALVNIDEEPALAAEYKVEVVPTLFLFRNGGPLGSVTAPGSKAAIDDFLRQHLGE